MKNDEYQKKMDSMLEKVGNDAGNLILDDVGLLITDNKQMNDEIEKQNKKIEELQKMNSTLQNINGNLLQQVSMGIDESISKKEENTEKEKKPFNMRDIFDEKGNFKV